MERLEAVEEITENEGLVAVLEVLHKLPDLEKGLCRLHYRRCTPAEFISILTAFHKVCSFTKRSMQHHHTPPHYTHHSQILCR